MPVRPCLALVAFLLVAPAHAADCPVARDVDAITAAIEKAASCAAAQKVFDSCAFGASIDSAFAGTVVDKCEKDFLTKLELDPRKSYDRQKAACEKKYDPQEGNDVHFLHGHVPLQARRELRQALRREVAQAGNAAFAFSTIAWNAAGSIMASSDSTLRSTATPDRASPSMKRL